MLWAWPHLDSQAFECTQLQARSSGLNTRQGQSSGTATGWAHNSALTHSWYSGPGLPAASQVSLTVSISPKVSGIFCQIRYLGPILESGKGAHQFTRFCVHLPRRHFLPFPGGSFPKASLCPVGVGFRASPWTLTSGRAEKVLEQLWFQQWARGPWGQKALGPNCGDQVIYSASSKAWDHLLQQCQEAET